MLLALGLESLGVGGDACLRLRDQLFLPVRQGCELVDDRMLGALEVDVPGVEPRLDLLLRRGERVAELVDRDARAFGGCGAALLRDPALLLGEN